MGSGTTLVEGGNLELKVTDIDINPLLQIIEFSYKY